MQLVTGKTKSRNARLKCCMLQTLLPGQVLAGPYVPVSICQKENSSAVLLIQP